MRDDPGSEQCLFRKGVRYAEQVKDHSKTCFSVMFCCSADGVLLPPMTVYKSLSGNFYTTWAEGGPPGSVFTCNKAGWFNMKEFETFFEKVFLPHLERAGIPKEDIKVLIMDNLASHLSPLVMELSVHHNVRLVFLPPNSTHLTQPLDVAVFSSMKKQWRVVLNEFKEECVRKNVKNVTIPKDSFARMLKELLENNEVNNARNIRLGLVPEFKDCTSTGYRTYRYRYCNFLIILKTKKYRTSTGKLR